jgi:hypothetical protein
MAHIFWATLIYLHWNKILMFRSPPPCVKVIIREDQNCKSQRLNCGSCNWWRVYNWCLKYRTQLLCLIMCKPERRAAVPWLRSLVAGLSPRRFSPGSIRVGFVVDKVALGQVFLRVLRFSPVNIIPPGLHTLVSSEGRTLGPLVTAVQRHSLTP